MEYEKIIQEINEVLICMRTVQAIKSIKIKIKAVVLVGQRKWTALLHQFFFNSDITTWPTNFCGKISERICPKLPLKAVIFFNHSFLTESLCQYQLFLKYYFTFNF